MNCKRCKTPIDVNKLGCTECATRNSETEILKRLHRKEAQVYLIPHRRFPLTTSVMPWR